MRQTYTLDNFEIELPAEDESMNNYYDVTLEVVADVSYEEGKVPSPSDPGSPFTLTIEVLSYKIVDVYRAWKEQLADLDARLHNNPFPSLDNLHEVIWGEFLIMQEDGGNED